MRPQRLVFYIFCNFVKFNHIGHISSKMDRNDCFCFFSNFFLNHFDIHAKTIIAINKNWFSTQFTYSANSSTKVFAAVITSSPGLIPIVFKLSFIASVPEFTPTAYFVPINCKFFFKLK